MSNDKLEKPLLEEAQQLAVNYNNRATEFSERIKTFQSQLRSIEFRVPTMTEFNIGSVIFRLSFTEMGGVWALYVDRKVSADKWKPIGVLDSRSVELKAAAAPVFHKLLENLIKVQREAIIKIEAAHTVLDDMAEKIGAFEEEAE